MRGGGGERWRGREVRGERGRAVRVVVGCGREVEEKGGGGLREVEGKGGGGEGRWRVEGGGGEGRWRVEGGEGRVGEEEGVRKIRRVKRKK